MKKYFDFMRWRSVATALSVLLVVVSLASLVVRGLSFGLDFTGGTLVEVAFDKPVELQRIRDALVEGAVTDAVVQYFGQSSEVLIRIPPDLSAKKSELGQHIVSLLKRVEPTVSLKRTEFVGPQVGEELRDQSGIAMLLALGAMLIYITFRFQFKFAVGAVVALFHDVIIVLGIFSLFGLQFDLTVLAAVLAVIGYSLNDTIVVSDRIRENFRVDRSLTPKEIVNMSLGQTLGRTLITSLTTLLVLVALKLLGGELISGFATALLIGVLVGTYSSIYVASNILLLLKFRREDLIDHAPEVMDDRP
ncbi:MAG: protein translocase subunit SecF [Gammaproteobacteria bacterium]